MKIAISNLAWKIEEENEVFNFLQDQGIRGLEVAPGKIFPDATQVSGEEALSYKNKTRKYNLDIVAFQAFLFGHPGLQLFGSETVRQKMKNHIEKIMKLASQLGARVLVYGAPKSRDRGRYTVSQALDIAIPFFGEVGEIAQKMNIIFCIEPNPESYGCNFITTSEEGSALVHAVNSKGFGLHLDTAGMHLAGEDSEAAIAKSAPMLQHFHISEPNLANLNSPQIDHEKIGAALRRHSYNKWVSIEMLESPESHKAIENALDLAKKYYGTK